MRVLVVGLNPSRANRKSPTFRTLYKWLDELDINIVSFINLYDGYEIDQGKNQKSKIKKMSKEYDKIIALGSEVSSALSRMDITHFRLPHPSGLNRQLNDEVFVHQQLKLCKNYIWSRHEIL